MTNKIAIIGGGIVGSTAAFYLHQAGAQVTLFDEGTGQATKAAAGIISPWLSKRRNQQWYRLATAGAALFNELVMDAHLTHDVYAKTGTILTRANLDDLDALEALAYERRENAPDLGEIYRLNEGSIRAMLPFVQHTAPGILITGGARIDGEQFCLALQRAAAVTARHERVALTPNGAVQTATQIESFDAVIVAAGAWLPELLAPLGLAVAVRPQKGQLIELALPKRPQDDQQPVLMPEGERDFIPTGQGRLIVGATHENDQGFDRTESDEIKTDLLASAQRVIPDVQAANITRVRVGTRAYTADFAPFFGAVPGHPTLFSASGLGSSGLTTGPIIGQQLAAMALGQQVNVADYTKPLTNYMHVI
ncbi:NAD(P)/FAD-dependent oxidoreductase [Furfurilactobacillus sp. WILCCON 0119]